MVMKKIAVLLLVLNTLFIRGQFSLGSYNPFFYTELPGWHNPALSTMKGVPELFAFTGTSVLGFPGRPVFYGLQGSGYIDYGVGFSAKFLQQKAGLSKNAGAELSFLYHLLLTKKIKLVFALSGMAEEYYFHYQDAINDNMQDPILTQQLQEIPSFNASFGLGLVAQDAFYLGIRTFRLIATKNNYLNNQIVHPVSLLASIQGGYQFNLTEKNILGVNALFEKEFAMDHYIYEGNIFYNWNGSLGFSVGYQSFKALKASINLSMFGLGAGYQISFSPWNDMAKNHSVYNIFSQGVYVKKLFNEQKPVR